MAATGVHDKGQCVSAEWGADLSLVAKCEYVYFGRAKQCYVKSVLLTGRALKRRYSGVRNARQVSPRRVARSAWLRARRAGTQ